MPALISRIHQTLRPSASAKLQSAQQKADVAIQKLHESEDPDVAAVLIARYEELKERHDRLMKLQEFASIEDSSRTTPAQNADENEDAPTRQINIDRLEDGTLKITFPPDELDDERPREFILTSPAFIADRPLHNIMITGGELIRTAMVAIGSNEQNLQDSQIMYLSNMYKSLVAQKEKIDSLEKTGASLVALEVAAQLYLTDTFRYLQSAQMIVNANQCASELDGLNRASDSDESNENES